MTTFIPQRQLSFTLFLICLILVTSCKTDATASSADHLKDYPVKTLKVDDIEIKVFIADTYERQKKGVSTIKSKDFKPDWGMLFPEDRMGYRQFWMPETHFDLDVIFMNGDYYILDTHKGLKHYPKKGIRGVEVPLSKQVFSQHVLEIRADSPIAKKIKPGMTLEFKSPK